MAERASPWLVVGTLVWRDGVRFLRQPSRVVGVVGQSLVFWLLLGSGVGAHLRVPGVGSGAGYLAYFYPGAIALAVLFASIFSNISVIEDRREGFLSLVQVAPVSRLSVVVGKGLGSTGLGFLQGWVLIALAPLAGIPFSAARMLLASAVLMLLSAALAGLGLALAWVTDSSQGYHAVMSFILFPLWMLSGALFPTVGLPTWLSWMVRLDPLTYGVAALRHALVGGAVAVAGAPASFAFSCTVMAVFALAGLGICWMLAERRSDPRA